MRAHRSIREIVVAFLPYPRNQLQVFRAVYAYLLRVENHHYFDRAMKAEGLDVETIRSFKEEFKYNWYVQDYWRAVLLFLRGEPLARVRAHHPIDPMDLTITLGCLTDDQFAALLHRATFVTTYKLPQAVLHGIVTRADPICRAAAYKLRWITEADAAFNGYEELQLEAIRVTLFYSSMADPKRVMAYVIKAVYNRADHLAKFWSRPERRRAEKLPEFRCGACSHEFVHHKHVLSAQQAAEKFGTITGLQAGCPYFCPACARKGNLQHLTIIHNEREYKTTVLSMDGASTNPLDKRTLSDVMGDPTQNNIDQHILEYLGDQALQNAISPISARFLRILLQGDAPFETWAADQDLEVPDDPVEMGHLVCQFLGVEYGAVQTEIGRTLRSSVFHVQVGDEDDLVCAHTLRGAVDIVARTYKFYNGRDMRSRLGEPVRVRCIDPFQQKYPDMAVGDVVPMDCRPG